MKTIFDILRGVVIGLANIIPGVSGGTMMVSMGIYDTIIGCINSLFKDFKRCVKMLWPYALGMVLGILGLAKLITFLLGSYPLPTNMAFIGLILGGLPMILKKMKGEKKGAAGAIAFVLAFALVVGLKIVGGGNSADASITLGLGQMIILFVIGVIAAATMVIPGVSGSMMLMLLQSGRRLRQRAGRCAAFRQYERCPSLLRCADSVRHRRCRRHLRRGKAD